MKPSDMFIEYNDENDPNLNNVVRREQSDDCSSSETEAGRADS